MGSAQLSQVMTAVSKYVPSYLYTDMWVNARIASRDPAQHASLQSEIEHQSTALYSTARLWDDGIIKPTDTRDVVGLALGLAARKSAVGGQQRTGSTTTTWDGDGKGFGVFRM
jgi:3-methylcrotonyl-CoA carboxylase beta subunit